ncbi:hypothetical protein ACS0TY_002875 [Phlomoides rotata]
MESSVLLPPVKNPIYTASTTMHEANSSHLPTPAAAATPTFKRFKPPQPPLFVPPGHVLFRLLCHASRIGGLIGKSGSIIKQLQQLTNSKIRVEDPPDSGDNRIISVLASASIIKQINLSAVASKGEEENNEGSTSDFEGEEEWFDVSAAQEGVVRVFERVVEVAADGDAVAGIGGVVSCRLLVSKNQGGVVIGKGGKVVEKIRRETGCRIKVLAVEMFSLGSSPMDEIVEIEGLGLGVKKALVAITGRLQEFLPLEKTRTYGTRPLESESLPIQTVELPQQRSPMLQPMPSTSVNHVWEAGPSLEYERVTDVTSRAPQQEVVFKILCPNERVGSIIGKGGSIVRTLQNETGALISIGPTLADCEERVITISAMESAESEYSAAQKATVVVFSRFMEYGLVRGSDFDAKGPPIARVMVPSHQVGCLLGKGGAIISAMRKVTGTGLRIIGGNLVPKCASENFEVLQITGEFANVQDALYKVTGKLRDNIFSTTILTGNGNRNSSRTENGSYGRSINHPPLSVGNSENHDDHKSLIQSVDHLAISSNNDRLPSPSVFTSGTVSGLNQGNSGRLPSVNGGVELGSGSRAASAANSTVKIVVPEAVFGVIYGDDGSNLTMLRQISGAKVIVHDPLPGATQRVVVISGTPDETQAAQSLLQAFMLTGS